MKIIDAEALLVGAKVNYSSNADMLEAIDMAIISLEKQIPKKPIIERYSPAYCPSCKAELSESIGDGYYKHHEGKSICECGQKLKWE
jgi:hypothetical protein